MTSPKSPNEKSVGAYRVDELSSSSLSIENEDLAVGQDNIFKDPAIYEHYKKVYEEANYECRHLLDPDFEWTPQEERKLVWKTEWRCCFVAFLFFFNLDIDRGNISSALGDNMLTDLKLTTNDYNLGSTINLVCFLSSELPSQLISKKLGPDVWIPLQMVLFSAIAMSQMAIQNRAGFFATRALLGALQGGVSYSSKSCFQHKLSNLVTVHT
ncbi:hypothetical protein AWJ20_217 [Sugiyamaella lignohabitans]|uniref:Allantoate permease n=1 Tax=Sugiyamaella lignohabitans TaxID=796027 RepID=A0A167CQK8_9ASCO|nr:uncharacterized protein AWJ20_217 [Sugiyamaella lignohabitans]ANB11989.1 hypothetical protein AWJ20_217 [Sugiyamaella lignohabitans]